MRFIIFALLLAVSTPAFAAPVPSFDALISCTTNAECVVVEPVCPGPWLAINKMHEADYNRRLPDVMTHVDCMMLPSQEKPTAAPVCKNAKCALAGAQ